MGADQTPLDVEAIRARLDAATITEGRSIGAIQNGKKELRQNAPADLRRLLDENARLNAEFADFREMAVLNTRAHNEALAARDRTVEALSARLTAKNTELDKTIREAAADKAKTEQLHDLLGGAAQVIWAALGHTEHFGDQEEARTFDSTWKYLGDAVQALSNGEARLEVRFDEVVAEKNQSIDDWYEAAKERDELACKVEAVRRTINPRNPGWKPLSERYPEYFEPDSTEEAARKKGWRQGVDLLTQRIKAALDEPDAAPEMPRPPAEEAALEYRCPNCYRWALWTDGVVDGDDEGVEEFWCQTCGSQTPVENMDSRPQGPAGDTNTAGTGSGRGTGVTEAPGTAQASDG